MQSNKLSEIFFARKLLLGLVIAAVAFSSQSVDAAEYMVLALQSEGQASVTIDDLSKTAYITDLGKRNSGRKIQVNKKDLVDYLVDGRHIENIYVSCSHPHSDHMGGIEELFENANQHFFVDGDLSKPRVKRLGLIDTGDTDSLASKYKAATEVGGRSSALALDHQVVWRPGQLVMRNGFETLRDLQQEVSIRTIDYAVKPPPPPKPGDAARKPHVHERSLITLIELPGAPRVRIVDFDDAENDAIRSAVRRMVDDLKITEIDTFLAPHHGSKYSDIDAIKELMPKHVIIAVNPNNRFGHPSAPTLERLVEMVGLENIWFTGSKTGVSIGSSGEVAGGFRAAQSESYALFLAGRKERLGTKREALVKAKKPTLAVDDELASIERVKQKMLAFKPPSDPQLADVLIGPGPGGGDEPPKDGMPLGDGPTRPRSGPGGASSQMLVDRAQATGTALSPAADGAYLGPNGVSLDALEGQRVLGVKAGPRFTEYADDSPLLDDAVRNTTTDRPGIREISYVDPSGLPSATVADAPAQFVARTPGRIVADPTRTPGKVTQAALPKASTLPRRIPPGGMVFLDGGRVAMDGDIVNFNGARLKACGAVACIETARDSDLTLPFGNIALFRDVLWRVSRGASSFYLSINPKKKLLAPNFPVETIPSNTLRSGTAPSPAALNDVVTTGGIETSPIGDILWKADVAFKSSALGFDVFSGARNLALPRLYVGAASAPDEEIAERDRWCRLYWGSGDPTISVNSASHRVAIKGRAVIAKAEAMLPRNGKLESYPRGGWCDRERQVAASLEKRANGAATDGVLTQLAELARMQSFALWAKGRGIDIASYAAAAAAVPHIPTWTSGIRSPAQSVVQLEQTTTDSFQGFRIHGWSRDPEFFRRCLSGTLRNMDTEWAGLGMVKTKDHEWKIPSGARPKFAAWANAATTRIARCGPATQAPVVSTTALEPGDKNGVGAFSTLPHLLSSQIHGGVLLAGSGGRSWPELYARDGALWSPDDRILFRRTGSQLHFWNLIGDPASPQGAQHVAISRGEVRQAYAADGHLRLLVRTAPGAVVSRELRLKTPGAAAPGFEWIIANDGEGGAPLIQKAIWATSGSGEPSAVAVGNLGEEPLLQAMKRRGIKQSLVASYVDNDLWLVDLDLGRLRAQFNRQPQNGEDASSVFDRARKLARWGYRNEAAAILEPVIDRISTDSEDTILREQVDLRPGDFNRLVKLFQIKMLTMPPAQSDARLQELLDDAESPNPYMAAVLAASASATCRMFYDRKSESPATTAPCAVIGRKAAYLRALIGEPGQLSEHYAQDPLK